MQTQSLGEIIVVQFAGRGILVDNHLFLSLSPLPTVVKMLLLLLLGPELSNLHLTCIVIICGESISLLSYLLLPLFQKECLGGPPGNVTASIWSHLQQYFYWY